MSRLEEVANVVLRVPFVLLLDLLYRGDLAQSPDPAHPAAWLRPLPLCSLYCLGHVVCVVLLTLPLCYLVDTYLYLLTSLLLYIAHRTVREFLEEEMESRHSGAAHEDPSSLTGGVHTLTAVVMVCTLCSLLMRTRQAWLFSAPVLPLLARLAGLPPLPALNTAAAALTLLLMSYTALSALGTLRRRVSTLCQELIQEMEVYRLVAMAMALWTKLAVSALFLVFWLVLYSLHVYKTLSSNPELLEQQGAFFTLLNSVSECCGTPYRLLGLTSTVSYAALGLLNLCKFYLLGHAAFHNGNVMHRGVTEGVTLLLLALQTGLLELQVLQRTFLLSIIFFIILTSTLQSMIEIADPILLALAATRNRSVWSHGRGLSLCLFLLLFPCVMAHKIASFFHMDFWLLILLSSCLLTSLQVVGTVFIYALFMVEQLRERGVDQMDGIIYGVHGVSRVLEFLVALSVVVYGAWESIFGEWSWLGASVILVHSYFNVWLRARSGWRSFLLRRKAAEKIGSLAGATEEQLRAHSDVCSICFQEMSVAVITTCGHFFHADCLKKWLYVQDTCPLCHQLVRDEDRDGEEEAESHAAEELLLGGIMESRRESMEKDSQEGDHSVGEEIGTSVGKDGPLIKETTAPEADTTSGRVVEHAPCMQVEEILLPSAEQEELLCRKEQEEISLKQNEVHNMVGQEKDIFYRTGLSREVQRQEVLWNETRQNEELYEEEEEDHCKEQKREISEEIVYRQKQLKKILSREVYEPEHKEKVLYEEEQSMLLYRKAEDSLDWEEQKRIPYCDTAQACNEENEKGIGMEEHKVVVYGEGEEMAQEDLCKETKGGHS